MSEEDEAHAGASSRSKTWKHDHAMQLCGVAIATRAPEPARLAVHFAFLLGLVTSSRRPVPRLARCLFTRPGPARVVRNDTIHNAKQVSDLQPTLVILPSSVLTLSLLHLPIFEQQNDAALENSTLAFDASC